MQKVSGSFEKELLYEKYIVYISLRLTFLKEIRFEYKIIEAIDKLLRKWYTFLQIKCKAVLVINIFDLLYMVNIK